jgi:hypothetical protein
MKKLIIILFTLSCTLQLTASDPHFRRKIFYNSLLNRPSDPSVCPCCRTEVPGTVSVVNADFFLSQERGGDRCVVIDKKKSKPHGTTDNDPSLPPRAHHYSLHETIRSNDSFKPVSSSDPLSIKINDRQEKLKALLTPLEEELQKHGLTWTDIVCCEKDSDKLPTKKI